MTLITVGEKQYTPEQAQALIDGLMLGAKHDVLGASPSAQVPHGFMFNQNVAGLLTRPGAEMGMWSTLIQPEGAWISALTTSPTVIVNPEYDIMTGVRDCEGDNGTDFCSDAPRAGFLKLCTTSERLGKFWMRTEQVVVNEIGGRINRADLNKDLINQPAIYPLMPDAVRSATNINSQTGMNMYALGITVHRWLTRAMFHGVYGTTGANAYCGFNREFNGFDRLIRTGYLDIDSGNHCLAADSRVIDWQHTLACETLNGYTLVDLFSWLMNMFTANADAGGMLPTQWVVAMNPNLFNALVQCWPCDYNTYGCNLREDNSERVVTGTELTNFRDQMRNGSYLPVNGNRLPVWQTSAIEETAHGPGFSGPIYVIPLSSLGIKTTYLEWFDQNNADIREYVANGMVHYRTSNNGLWAVTERQTGMCHEYYFAAQPRLVMRTPWLAARIENVVYEAPFDLYLNSPYPSEPYHRDGGRYYSSGPYYGGDWANIGQPLQR